MAPLRRDPAPPIRRMVVGELTGVADHLREHTQRKRREQPLEHWIRVAYFALIRPAETEATGHVSLDENMELES